MCTDIKNGKLRTINIYVSFLLLWFIITLSINAELPKPDSNGKWVIVIDPGHGGIDPGATGSFSKEKNINLAIALRTGEYIEQNLKNVTVIYTRKEDSTVDLIERPRIANSNNANLFISVHSNSTKVSRNIMGAETYIMGLASNQENLEVAMKENEVILLEDNYSTKYQGFDPKSPESYIIFSLIQNVYQKQSLDLAWKIQTQFTERVDRKDRGVKQAGFWVLYNTSMPSVLIETGFISNPAEERYLNSKTGQDYLASAIYRACRDYINEIDNMSNISVQVPETQKEIPSELSLPESKIVFKVQVSTSSNRIAIKPENFKGLTDITEISEQDRHKYATGSFTEYPEAVKYRRKIEQIYPDAFVIAVKDNKVLPLQQVLNEKKKK
jgi:N-acetylmuramoyl-L-alanine amidase